MKKHKKKVSEMRKGDRGRWGREGGREGGRKEEEEKASEWEVGREGGNKGEKE